MPKKIKHSVAPIGMMGNEPLILPNYSGVKRALKEGHQSLGTNGSVLFVDGKNLGEDPNRLVWDASGNLLTIGSTGYITSILTHGNYTSWGTPDKLIRVQNTNKADIGILGSYTSGGALILKNAALSQNVIIRSYGDSYLNGGKLGIGTATPAEKLDLNGGNMTTRDGATYTTIIPGGLVNKNVYTGGSWSRNLMAYTNNADASYFNVGGFGTGQTFLYGYIGLQYNATAIKITAGNLMAFGLSSTTAPTKAIQFGTHTHWLGDNYKAVFGAGEDASIYYDGTNLIFDSQEVGTGSFEFKNGDLFFSGSGSGLPYGEIYVHGNTTGQTIATATLTQVTTFDTNGVSNLTTPDHTTDDITIIKTGVYMVTLSSAFSGDPNVTWIGGVYKNNGVTQLANLQTTRKLGAGGDVGSVSISGLVSLTANDTIEVWFQHAEGVNKSIVVQDLTLSLVMVGG